MSSRYCVRLELFEEAACAGSSKEWTEGEAAWARSRSSASARLALKPLYAMCANCPVRLACEEWARADKYSGVAAGMLWVNGRPSAGVRVPRRLSKAS